MEVEALADSFEFPQIFIRGRAMRAPTGLYVLFDALVWNFAESLNPLSVLYRASLLEGGGIFVRK